MILAEVVFRQGGRSIVEEMDWYGSLEEAMEGVEELAYEDEPESLRRSVILLRDSETGVAVAVGIYWEGSLPLPEFVWVHGDEKRRKRDDREGENRGDQEER
jgi:hypothetical protein